MSELISVKKYKPIHTTNEKKESEMEWTKICVRVSVPLLKEMDEKIKNRVGLCRNAWIMEAFQEKLKRDEQ